MKLIVNNEEYPCTGKPSFGGVIRFTLPGDKPDVEKISGTIKLCSNDGFVLRGIESGNYARWYISGDTLIGTNTPEPEPVEPVPEPEPEPSAQDDVDAMLVDHEYRLTLLELGITE